VLSDIAEEIEEGKWGIVQSSCSTRRRGCRRSRSQQAGELALMLSGRLGELLAV
jgi:hypothetical protein